MTARVRRTSVLDAPADVVWAAVRAPATLAHVASPVLLLPGLDRRVAPWRVDEVVTVRPWLLGVLPLNRHQVRIATSDEAARRVETAERSGLVRSWRHRISVVPDGAGRGRYTDDVVLDAGLLTPAVALFAHGFYAWRHRRWRRLARVLAAAAARPSGGAVSPAESGGSTPS